MSKEGTRGTSKGKSCLLLHQNCSEPISYCTVSHSCGALHRLWEYPFALLRFITPHVGCWLCYNHTPSTALQSATGIGQSEEWSGSPLFPSCPVQFTGYFLAVAWNTDDIQPVVDPRTSANVKMTHFKFNLLEPIFNQVKSLYGLHQ